jgi:F-type H+-transporting ATPase subunit delta
VRESIRGYTDAVIEDAEASGRLADLAGEMDGVRSVLEGSDDLRWVLSNPGQSVQSRRAVVDELFASRISPQALGLVYHVLNVDRASEVFPNLGWLATRLQAARDGLVPVGGVVLGRAAAAERIEGYASAVLSSVNERDALGETEDSLFRFARIVDGSPELHDALTSRDMSPAARRDLVVGLLADRADPATVRLAAYATRIGRPRDYPDLLNSLVDQVAALANRRVADVSTAVPLNDAQESSLTEALGRVVGHPVEVRARVDPAVLGGFLATIGDVVVDGSVRHRIELLRKLLVLPEAAIPTTGPFTTTTGEAG